MRMMLKCICGLCLVIIFKCCVGLNLLVLLVLEILSVRIFCVFDFRIVLMICGISRWGMMDVNYDLGLSIRLLDV